MLEKQLSTYFAFCTAGDAEKKGTFDLILNFKYFIQAAKFQWPSQKLLWLLRNLLRLSRRLYCSRWEVLLHSTKFPTDIYGGRDLQNF
jgi:hypothetical protein